MQTQELKTSWQECLGLLRDKVQPQSYNTWLKPTKLISGDNESLVLGVPNRFVASWLEGHYIEHINEAVDIFVQARGSDMLAFVNKKHTFFTNLFSKPMVKELGMKSKVPVLALHDHSD